MVDSMITKYDKSKIMDKGVWTRDDDNHLFDLSAEVRERVLAWIKNGIMPRKTPLYDRTSYGIKHVMQRQTGIYVTNNQFKEAMLECGYAPVDENEYNWVYHISKKSPAFIDAEWEEQKKNMRMARRRF